MVSGPIPVWGNIIWFIPLGSVLLASGKVKGIQSAAVCGLFLSLIIETLQYLFGTEKNRLKDTDIGHTYQLFAKV
uniref:VanZ family protein n=1 Tax=Enterocloster aldenensis TaxID=358742 RepID=UPI00336C2B2F